MSRAALVKEGKRLKRNEEGAQWAWGDLLAKTCPKDAPPAEVTEAVQILVSEVFPELDEIGQRTKSSWMRLCRQTSLAWPIERRAPEVSHKVHEIFKHRPNRFSLIRRQKKWTITEAYRAIDAPAFSRTTRNAPHDERAKAAIRLLGDDKVAQLLMSDSNMRTLLMQAAFSVDKERLAQRRHEPSPEFVRISSYTRTSKALYNAQGQLERSLDLAMSTSDFTEPMRAALLRQAQKAQLVCEFLVSHLESGDRSFDESMRSLLEEEAL